MFGFKIIRRSKQDEKDALSYRGIVMDMYDVINKIIDKLSSSIPVGDMEITHIIGERIKSIDSLLGLYNLNKFSSPSAYLVINDFLKGLIKQFKAFAEVQTKMKALTYEVLKYHNDMTLHPEKFDRENDERLKRKCELLCEDSESALSIIIPEMRTMLIGMRAALTPEKERILHDVDIVDDFYKRKKLKADGTKYQISFKMVDKASQIGNKSTEEENSNVLQKGK